MKDSFWNHPIKTLEKALSIGEEIEALQKQLAALLSGESTIEVTMSPKKGKRRTFSTATLAKMRAAQQARWAKVKEAMNSTTPSNTRSASARMKKKSSTSRTSPATRAKVAAAQRTKWTKQTGELKVAGDALTKPAKKKKGGLTPEGRDKLAAAMKARWAKAKNTGAGPLNAPK